MAHKRSHPDVVDLTGDDEADADADSTPAPTPSSRTVKRPRYSPPSSSNPVVEAARSGQATRLVQLLQNYRGHLGEAMIAAAANGHGNCVVALRDRFVEPWDDECHLSLQGRAVMGKAVGFAARNGTLAVVEFMLAAMSDDGEDDEEATMSAFIQAVQNGRLDVVKYTAELIYPGYHDFKRHIKLALGAAILGGYADIVAFLLTWEHADYNVGGAFEIAVRKNQHAVANKIYEIYPQLSNDGNLLVDMAASGRLVAVQYLYEHGRKDATLVGEALRRATANKRTDVIEFLRGAARDAPARAF